MILLCEKIFPVCSKIFENVFTNRTFNISDALYSTITPTFFKKRATPTVVAKTIEPLDPTQPSSQPTSKDSQVQNQSSKSNPKRPDTDKIEKEDEDNKQITSIEDSLPIY